MRLVRSILIVLVCVSAQASTDVYLKSIKPLLQERCYSCHGALSQKSRLRVDTVAALIKGGSGGPAIAPGKPDESAILKRVATTDLDERMPPEHEGQPFDEKQIATLRDWIAAGAPGPADEKAEPDPRDHWAFRPIQRPAVPSKNRWVRNPIDAFIAQGHAEQHLTPQPEAAPEILLRRLYLGLIGLPPSAEDILAAKSDPRGAWYETTARRLLDDPRHGERWARHWMDIWRYSDPYGLGEDYRNSQRHIWHWRDWIVESLNNDVPYSEMVKLMLAADELHPTDLDKLRATGFLARNFYIFNRNQWLEETVEHVSKGFLGLTMNCAKCHDHKYDPIRQTDFYQMRAFFEPYQVRQDFVLGEADPSKNAIPRAFDALLETPTYRFIRGNEGQPDKSVALTPAAPRFLTFKEVKIEKLKLPRESADPARRDGILKMHMDAAIKRRDETAAALATAREPLVTALRREADLIADASAAATNRSAAKLSVDEARAAFNLAEATAASARAEVVSVRRRIEAMRAGWAVEDAATADPALIEHRRDRTAFAVLFEREAALAKAQANLADAEARLVKAAAEKKEAIAKDIKDAREAVDKAQKLRDAEVAPEDAFTPLPGAKWSATRFANSTADDPAVKFPSESSGRRKALAEWIVDSRNPLTARVAVNHIWARHFGTPLVASTFEFGRKGAAPTHPELLDWLAAELIESGWSMKRIHSLIVNSATYRMSSSNAGAGPNIEKDPDNIRLWRRNAIRLEAEVIRDSMLAFSGELDPAIGGPTVPADKQEASRRRSLYFFHSNNDRNLFLTTFDGAGVRECYRREQSIVPQQALALNNSKLALEAAMKIAAGFAKLSDDEFVSLAMLTLLSIDPSEKEKESCLKALGQLRKTERERAREHLIWALMNHNDFITLR